MSSGARHGSRLATDAAGRWQRAGRRAGISKGSRESALQAQAGVLDAGREHEPSQHRWTGTAPQGGGCRCHAAGCPTRTKAACILATRSCNNMKIFPNPYSTRSQMIILLLGALFERKGAYTKQDVLSIIERLKWFDLRQDDKIPYQTVQSKEPRWKTLIAYTRKDCVEDKLFMDDGCHDSWQISKRGRNVFAMLKGDFSAGNFDCSKCYMWSQAFKKHMCPDYVPTERDLDRPGDVYKDYYPTNQLEKWLSL